MSGWRWSDFFLAVVVFVAAVLWLVIGIGTCQLVAGGCSPAPAPSAVAGSIIEADPFEGADWIAYAADSGAARLVLYRDGTAVLVATVAGNTCPVGGHSGALLKVGRAFVGIAGPPSVGDTLGGGVVQSALIDTLAVTGGRFWALCAAPDTLVGFAWLRLSTGASCQQDSIASAFRLVRSMSSVPVAFPSRAVASPVVAGSEFGNPARTGSEAFALRSEQSGRPTLCVQPRALRAHAGT